MTRQRLGVQILVDLPVDLQRAVLFQLAMSLLKHGKCKSLDNMSFYPPDTGFQGRLDNVRCTRSVVDSIRIFDMRPEQYELEVEIRAWRNYCHSHRRLCGQM